MVCTDVWFADIGCLVVVAVAVLTLVVVSLLLNLVLRLFGPFSGMRSTRQATMGDTIIKAGASPPPSPLAIIEPSKSMLFASVYPLGEKRGLGRLKARENHPSFGNVALAPLLYTRRQLTVWRSKYPAVSSQQSTNGALPYVVVAVRLLPDHRSSSFVLCLMYRFGA